MRSPVCLSSLIPVIVMLLHQRAADGNAVYVLVLTIANLNDDRSPHVSLISEFAAVTDLTRVDLELDPGSFQVAIGSTIAFSCSSFLVPHGGREQAVS